jgi:hypothetical protein
VSGSERQTMERHVVVPDLHDAAGLLAPDAARERLLAEFGSPRPETATATAHRLAKEGVSPIVIHGGRNDMRACRVLSAELARSGLRTRIELAQQQVDNTPLSHHGICIVDVQSFEAQALKKFADDCRRNVERFGPSKVLIRTPGLTEPEESLGMRASPIPASSRLELRPWRKLLTALVAECWSTRIAAWTSLLQADALAVNSIENVYAGQSLRDRNRDLLVNIL